MALRHCLPWWSTMPSECSTRLWRYWCVLIILRNVNRFAPPILTPWFQMVSRHIWTDANASGDRFNQRFYTRMISELLQVRSALHSMLQHVEFRAVWMHECLEKYNTRKPCVALSPSTLLVRSRSPFPSTQLCSRFELLNYGMPFFCCQILVCYFIRLREDPFLGRPRADTTVRFRLGSSSD